MNLEFIHRTLTPPEGRAEIEKDAEDAFRKIVKHLGGFAFKLKFISVAGAPDRIVFMPGARIYFVELKRLKGGKLERSQEIMFPRLEALGFKIHVLRGLAGVRAFVFNHLIGL